MTRQPQCPHDLLSSRTSMWSAGLSAEEQGLKQGLSEEEQGLKQGLSAVCMLCVFKDMFTTESHS